MKIQKEYKVHIKYKDKYLTQGMGDVERPQACAKRKDILTVVKRGQQETLKDGNKGEAYSVIIHEPNGYYTGWWIAKDDTIPVKRKPILILEDE